MDKENVNVPLKKQKLDKEQNEEDKISVYTDDGKVFYSQKSNIIKYSPVFRAMFQYDTKENQTNSIKIKGHDSEIVDKFLKHFVTNDVEGLENIVVEMFVLADYYQVEDLKELCFEIIDTNLSSQNVFTFHEKAKKFGLDKLKEKCIEFMCQNISITTFFQFYKFANTEKLNNVLDKVTVFINSNISEVTKSDEWKTFDDKFKLNVLESFVQQHNDKLLDEELSLSIEEKKDHGGKIRGLYNSDWFSQKRSFMLKNRGNKRVVFQIVCDVGNHEFMMSIDPSFGFLNPDEECKVSATYNDYVFTCVMFEASEEKDAKNCFKNNTLVRQIEIDWSIFPGRDLPIGQSAFYSDSNNSGDSKFDEHSGDSEEYEDYESEEY